MEKIQIVRDYLDIDGMINDIKEILNEIIDSHYEEKEKEMILEEFSIDRLSLEYAIQWNDDMQKYLHQKSQDIPGCLMDVRLNYESDTGKSFDEMVKRLDSCDDYDEEAAEDRAYLNQWFWECNGTYGFTYNMMEMFSEYIYEVTHNEEK